MEMVRNIIRFLVCFVLVFSNDESYYTNRKLFFYSLFNFTAMYLVFSGLIFICIIFSEISKLSYILLITSLYVSIVTVYSFFFHYVELIYFGTVKKIRIIVTIILCIFSLIYIYIKNEQFVR